MYEEIIKDNIAYDILLQDRSLDRDRLNEIVDLMLETVCTARKKIRIAGDDYPAELVKSKFMKLNSEHIRFVLDCMQENTTKIRNIKQYLKAVLFNAPSTIDSYKTLSFSKIEGRHGTFAFLDKSEDRSRNIRKARPSVRAQLTADKKTAAPKKAAAKRKNHDLEV